MPGRSLVPQCARIGCPVNSTCTINTVPYCDAHAFTQFIELVRNNELSGAHMERTPELCEVCGRPDDTHRCRSAECFAFARNQS